MLWFHKFLLWKLFIWVPSAQHAFLDFSDLNFGLPDFQAKPVEPSVSGTGDTIAISQGIEHAEMARANQ
jgi:hypothetical protein